MAVIAAVKLDDGVSSRKSPGKPDCTHGRFGSGIHHADHLYGRNRIDDHFGKSDFKIGGRAKAGPSFQNRRDRFDNRRMPMPQDHGSPGTDIVDKGIAVFIINHAAVRMIYKKRLRAHGFASPGRAVDAPGNDILCQVKESLGFFAIHGFIVLSLF